MSVLNHLLSFIFLMSLSFQAEAFDVPSLTGPVVDQVSLLSQRTKSQLEEVLYTAKAKTGLQVQVLIVSSLQNQEIEQVAIEVFDKWQLGTKKIDNGVLFLIAPSEKKMRIEVGRGLEGNIPDVIAKRIISDTVRPYFKNSEFDVGVAQGVYAILHYAEEPVDPNSINENRSEGKSSGGGGNWIAIIFVLLWVVLFIFNPTLAVALLFRGGGGRGGGGGYGGWSGGGGGSSGGGASGSW